jgi:hypothetical protein
VTEFRKKPLGLLDTIYGFVGGLRGVSRLALAQPITVVHDVSREAELGGFDGFFGRGQGAVDGTFFTIAIDNVHGAASTIQTGVGVYSNQSTTWALPGFVPPDPDRETVWLLRSGVTAVLANLLGAYITAEMQPKAGSGSGNTPDHVVFFSSSMLMANLNGEFPCVNSLAPHPPIPLSNKLLNNTPLVFVSQSSAVGAIDFYAQCVRLPNGVFPPGWRG